MHRFARRSAMLALLIGLGLVAGGCGQDEIPTCPVCGKVTYKGRPVPPGKILFTGVDPGLPNAMGEIDSDGAYRLTTHKPGDGAAAGDYKVTILVFDLRAPATDVSTWKPKPLIPIQYTTLDKTPLVQTVKKQPVNTIDFEL